MPQSSNQQSDEPAQLPSVDASAADRNRAVVRDAFDAWAGARGSVFHLPTDDAVWINPGSTAGAGEWTDGKLILTRPSHPLFNQLAVPTHPELSGLRAYDDQMIIRWRQNTPLKAGGSYRNEYAWFFTMHDEKIIAVTAFLDLPAYAAAVGGES